MFLVALAATLVFALLYRPDVPDDEPRVDSPRRELPEAPSEPEVPPRPKPPWSFRPVTTSFQGSYPARFAAGRERLRIASRKAWEAAPRDGARYLVAAMFDDLPVLADPTPDTAGLVAEVVCGLTLCPLGSEKTWRRPTAAEAERALATLEAAYPQSSWTPIYRLAWLLLDADARPQLFAEAHVQVREALRRNDFRSPLRDHELAAHDWIASQESDSFVRAAIKYPYRPRGRWAVLELGRVLESASQAPVPPRAELQPLAMDLGRLVDAWLQVALDADGLSIATWSFPYALCSEVLLAARTGDRPTVVRGCADHERWLAFEANQKEWVYEWLSRTQGERWLDYPAFTALGPSRLPRLESRGGDAAEPAPAAPPASEIEPYRQVDAAADDMLRTRRETLASTAPLAAAIRERRAVAKRSALAWILRDGLLDGRTLSADRLEHWLDHAYGDNRIASGEDAGRSTYAWLVYDALRDPKSASIDAIRERYSRTGTIRTDPLVHLLARGVQPTPDDRDRALDEAIGHEAQSYLRLLGYLATRDPARVATCLPSGDDLRLTRWEVGLAETLRWATGLDLGYDLERWREALRAAATRR